VIAFGHHYVDAEAFERWVRPGIEASRGPEDVVLVDASTWPVARGLNGLLDRAAALDGLEALVVVGHDVELAHPGLGAVVRALDAPLGGMAGGQTGLAWWDGEVVSGPVTWAHPDLGGGERPAWPDAAPAPGDVRSLDPGLLVLPAATVRALRFDERLWQPGAAVAAACARAERVQVLPIRATVHRRLELLPDEDAFLAAHVALAEALEDDEQDWRARARRAEAELEAQRKLAHTAQVLHDLRLEPLEARLEALEDDLGWRLTRPLREVNLRRRARGAARRG
jgi:hypothetical protein